MNLSGLWTAWGILWHGQGHPVAARKKTKDEQVRVRLTAEQKRQFVREAERGGLTLSSWIVNVCLKASFWQSKETK